MHLYINDDERFHIIDVYTMYVIHKENDGKNHVCMSENVFNGVAR